MIVIYYVVTVFSLLLPYNISTGGEIMASNSIDGALVKLKGFITNLHRKGDLSERELKPFEIGVLFGSADEGNVVLDHKQAKEYRECLDELYNSNKIRKKHSKRAVEILMQEAILHALALNNKRCDKPFEDRLSEAIKELKGKLHVNPKPWVVHMRVEGLAKEGLPYKFGKVQFWLADEHNLGELKDKCGAIPDRGTVPSESSNSDIDEYFLNHPIASIEVSACDAEAARFTARRELRLTLDVINFYSQPKNTKAQAYFVGELQPTKEIVLAYEIEGSSCHYRLDNVGPFALISLKDMEPSGIENPVFCRISKILGADHRTEIEEKILASIQWAGRAAVELQERREEAFLHYAIALETIMLGRKQDAELTYRLSMRTALLAGDTPEKRVEIKKEIRELYGIRSKIVHSGLYEVTDDDVAKIRSLVVTCIMRILTKEPFISMTKEDQIDDWFDQTMLSACLMKDDAYTDAF